MVNIIADSIAALQKRQSATDTGVAESGVDNVISLGQRILIGISSNLRVYTINLPISAFVLDHPVYGDLDSSVLHIDGGYAETSVLHDSVEV